MNFIETLHLETLENDSDSIKSLFGGVVSRYNNAPSASMESVAFGKVFKTVSNMINFKKEGSFEPNIISQYKVTEDWLTTKEKVIQSPVTYSHVNLSVICGHILRSREVIGGAEGVLNDFIKHIAMLISDVDKLATMSGLDPVVTPKNSTVHGIPALRRMIDLSRPSQIKLESLFNSVSDMNVTVNMANDLNLLMGNVDLPAISKKIERAVELIEILEKATLNTVNKKNIESIINQTSMLASLFSDISYVATVADQIADTLENVHEVIA